jgi:hypothetical protein
MSAGLGTLPATFTPTNWQQFPAGTSPAFPLRTSPLPRVLPPFEHDEGYRVTQPCPPHHEIRADFDRDTIVIYQAFQLRDRRRGSEGAAVRTTVLVRPNDLDAPLERRQSHRATTLQYRRCRYKDQACRTCRATVGTGLGKRRRFGRHRRIPKAGSTSRGRTSPARLRSQICVGPPSSGSTLITSRAAGPCSARAQPGRRGRRCRPSRAIAQRDGCAARHTGFRVQCLVQRPRNRVKL